MMRHIRDKIRHTLLERWHASYSPIPQLPPCVFRLFRGSTSITLIDAGANKGNFTRALNMLCPLSNAILIEPIEVLAENLRADASFSRFHVIDCALSDFDGEIKMNLFPSAPDMSSALAIDLSVENMAEITKSAPIQVNRPARKLDTVVAEFPEFPIDLLKIDVQGLEHVVIQGGTATLARTKAVFTEVSFRPLYTGSSLFFDVHRSLTSLGFILTDLEPGFRTRSGEILQADALFVRGPKSSSANPRIAS